MSYYAHLCRHTMTVDYRHSRPGRSSPMPGTSWLQFLSPHRSHGQGEPSETTCSILSSLFKNKMVNVEFKILFSITGNFPSNSVSLLSNNTVNVVVVKVRKK